MDRPDYRKIFTDNIRKRRKAMGLSLADLAQRSGLSPKILEALDQDMIPDEMMVDDAFLLADVFQCKTYELFEEQENISPKRIGAAKDKLCIPEDFDKWNGEVADLFEDKSQQN